MTSARGVYMRSLRLHARLKVSKPVESEGPVETHCPNMAVQTHFTYPSNATSGSALRLRRTTSRANETLLCLPGGASDPGERLGVHVERADRLHPLLPLQPGHRAQGRGPRQTAPAEQGNTKEILQDITGATTNASHALVFM